MLTFSVKYVWQWLLDNFRCTNIATNANQVSMHAAALSSKTKCNMFLRIESLVHFKETMHSIGPFLKKIRYLPKHLQKNASKWILISNDMPLQWSTMASLRHILMGRNGDYFLNYIDYSKLFDTMLKLLLPLTN